MTDKPTRARRWRIANHPAGTEAQAAILEWARENNLDPTRILARSIEIDDDARVIHYEEVVPEGTPGAHCASRNATWTRPATAPLLTAPPPAAYGYPAPRLTPSAADQAAARVLQAADVWRSASDTAAEAQRAEADLIAAVDTWRKTRPATLADLPTGSVMPPAGQRAAINHDWTRYQRTCAPDRRINGTDDLALFLGGSATSFTGQLLALIEKAQATPANLAAIERGFPREVTAWRTWQSLTIAEQRPPTAAELHDALTLQQKITETRAEMDRAHQQHHRRRTPDQFGDH